MKKKLKGKQTPIVNYISNGRLLNKTPHSISIFKNYCEDSPKLD